jgi:pilus assembly protein CpaB
MSRNGRAPGPTVAAMVHPFARRLPRSAVAWFAGAAVAAAGATLAVRSHVAGLESNRPDLGPPTSIVVAASDLGRGGTLAAGSLRVVDVPAALVPPGAVASADAVAGRVLVADMAEGEALTETRLAGAGDGPIAALVPPGLRAFVLPIGPPAGTVRAGDEIDVLATFGANAGRPYTETVASGLEVLQVIDAAAPVATGSSGAPAEPPIVVLADPLTVERLARAASLALLSIAITGDDVSVTDPFSEGGTTVDGG